MAPTKLLPALPTRDWLRDDVSTAVAPLMSKDVLGTHAGKLGIAGPPDRGCGIGDGGTIVGLHQI